MDSIKRANKAGHYIGWTLVSTDILVPFGGYDVTLCNSVPNGSFESPALSDYQYRPADAAWTYGDSAGITANGGRFSGSSEPAPDGVQSGFIEGTGSLWRTFTLASGTHTFSFQAAQAVSLNESSQQVRVTLLGLPTSTKTFVWSGNSIAEERDATGLIVTKRFFAEGEQRVGGDDAGNYYYSRDHLGSVREVTDASGVLQVQYDYDAWGNQVVVTGNMSFDFGYTGDYRHAASNLYLAEYRAYDPTFGRWVNRDPIGEKGGINLYGYARNNSLRWTDRSGLLVPLPPVLVPPSVVVALPAVSPWLWPVGAGLLGYTIGDTPVVKDWVDDLFTKNWFNNADDESIFDVPDPNITNRVNKSPEELQWDRDYDDCEKAWESLKGGCRTNHEDRNNFMKKCMEGKGYKYE